MGRPWMRAILVVGLAATAGALEVTQGGDHRRLRLIDKEVNAVARTLVQYGIDVTAIHNHGLMDTPRLFSMHFWANDDPVKLAQGLKAALSQTNSAKP